jgi:integration host factor subunit beta
MRKSDLIKKVQQSIPNYPPKDLACAVNIIFAAMFDMLISEGRIEIRGFGSFSVRSRAERSGCNPKSGKIFSVPQRKTPFFKVAKELHHMINGSS